MSIPKRPEKKVNGFDDDVYCNACRLSETFCQCKGYNQAIEEFERFLPSEDEMLDIINKNKMDKKNPRLMAVNFELEIAKAISKRLRNGGG